MSTRSYARQPTIDLPVGTVGLSPIGRPRPTKYDWDGARALMEANPGLWVLGLRDASTGIYTWVRRGKVQAFIGMGGQLQISLRNQRPKAEGSPSRVGDLWLRWTPAGWTDLDQARAEAAHAAGEGGL